MAAINPSNEPVSPPFPPPLPPPPAVFRIVRQSSQKTTSLSEEKKELYKKAWEEVKEGTITIYGAAKNYGLSKSTLRKWCLRDELDELPTVGRPCYLGTALESVLKEWVLESHRLGSYFNNFCNIQIMNFVSF